MSNPKIILGPFAENGDKRDIPLNTPPDTGEFSYDLGFPPITSVPLEEDGKAPEREDFNELFNVLSQHTFFLQSGSNYIYNPIFTYEIGATILGSDNALYVCLAQNAPNNVQDPVTSTGYWRKMVDENGNLPISSLSGVLPVANGGTGSNNVDQAWSNVGGGSIGRLNTLSANNIPYIDASKVNSGIFQSWQIPSLDASKIASGTLPTYRGGTGRTNGAMPVPVTSSVVGQIISAVSPVNSVYTVPSGSWYVISSYSAGTNSVAGQGLRFNGADQNINGGFLAYGGNTFAARGGGGSAYVSIIRIG